MHRSTMIAALSCKHDQSHQRYVEREIERKNGEKATLYSGVEVASDGEADDIPIQVFVQ